MLADSPIHLLQVTMLPLKPDGGLSGYVRSISRRLADAGDRVTVVGYAKQGVEPEADDVSPNLTYLTASQPKRVAREVSAALDASLRRAVAEADVVHLHGMRTGMNGRAARYAKEAGKPLIVSPHGQVHPWLRSQRRFRKAVVDCLFDRRIYRQAKLGVAMTLDEQDHLTAFCPSLQTRVVPIGIEPTPAVDPAVKASLLERAPALGEDRWRVLFLASLTRRKGFDLLVEAFAGLDHKVRPAQLVMAGPDAEHTHAQLTQDLWGRGVKPPAIVQLPRMNAAERTALLELADVFVMPSRSENFGIVVLEALDAGVPVLTTTSTPWHRTDPTGTVVSRPATAAGLRDGLRLLQQESPDDHRRRSADGQTLVNTRFRWPPIIDQLRSLYREQLNSR